VIISALVLHGVLNAFVLENTSMRKGKALRNIRAIIFGSTASEKFDVIDPEEVIVDFRK
jgi:hypothetical protein